MANEVSWNTLALIGVIAIVGVFGITALFFAQQGALGQAARTAELGGTPGTGGGGGGIVTPAPPQCDFDGDGYYRAVGSCPSLTTLPLDCDDDDPNTHPGATEVCDGKDNNCDGTLDNIEPRTCSIDAFYYGKTACSNAVEVCVGPDGVVTSSAARTDDTTTTDELTAAIESLKPGVSAAFNWYVKLSGVIDSTSFALVNVPMFRAVDDQAQDIANRYHATLGQVHGADHADPAFGDGGYEFEAGDRMLIRSDSVLDSALAYQPGRGYAVEVYARQTPTGTYQVVVAKGSPAGPMPFSIEIDQDGILQCRVVGKDASGSETVRAVATSAIFRDGNKHLVTCVVNAPEFPGTVALYVDGTLLNFVPLPSKPVANAASICFGNWCGVTDGPNFAGWIGDFRVYPRALYREQVEANWRAVQVGQPGRYISSASIATGDEWYAMGLGTTDADGASGNPVRTNTVAIR